MATATGSPGTGSSGRTRALRIGVLLGGKIVEERLIRERVSVTIGQSAKATFSIPLEELPRQMAVFEVKDDRYVLNFTAKMDGRLSDGDKVLTLDQAKTGGAVKHDDHWSLKLSSQARGKISLGELTLLFQFVSAPPIQPRPQLPHSVRGTFVDRIDPRLSVILAASIAVHFGLMLYAVLVNDPDTGDNLAEMAERATFKDEEYVVTDFTLPEPPKADTGEVKAPEPAKVDKPSTPKPDRKPAAGGTEAKPEREASDAVALREESVRYADMLFSDDDSSATGLAGGMERRKPGSELKGQLDEVAASGARTEVGGGATGRGTRGGGDPRMGTGSGPGVEGPAGPVSATGPGGKQEKVPQGRISVSDKKSFDDSTLTPDAVLRKIQSAYMGGIKRCQKQILLRDPSARGKVKLNFTVNATGRTVSPRAKGFDSELDSCIAGLMNNWRFDIPKDTDGEATDASFEIGLQLVPE